MTILRTDTMIREAWLIAAWNEVIVPMYREAEIDIPENVHISLGFSKGHEENASVRGATFAKEAANDGSYQVFVSPFIKDGYDVLLVLAHEAAHVIDDLEHGHDKGFQEIAAKVGFAAPFTTSLAMPPDGQAQLILAAEALGEWPHAGMDPLKEATERRRAPVTPGGAGMAEPAPVIRWSSGPVKQYGSRMVKVVCPHDGYTVRTSRKWLDLLGPPLCPVGGHGPMVEQ